MGGSRFAASKVFAVRLITIAENIRLSIDCEHVCVCVCGVCVVCVVCVCVVCVVCVCVCVMCMCGVCERECID